MNSPSPCLPNDFQFSQSSLRDYQECPRRFQLRYLDHRAWPAAISEPALDHERRMLRGAAFHRMVQQHQAGIDPARLSQMLENLPVPADDDCLRQWWLNYLDHSPSVKAGRRYVEYGMTARVAGYRLLARYDLLLVEQAGNAAARVLILDWKTSARPQRPERYLGAIQTRVYRYVLARSGSMLNMSVPVLPEQIQMVYWFAETPTEPIRIPYSTDLYADDERSLVDLIVEISAQKPDEFRQSEQQRGCKFCVYRSLCGRGTRAGGYAADEDLEEAGLPATFEAVEEIHF